MRVEGWQPYPYRPSVNRDAAMIIHLKADSRARLVEFPRIGAPRPKFGPAVRIWTVEPSVIYYRYAEAADTVRVLRILHGKRNVSRRVLAAERVSPSRE